MTGALDLYIPFLDGVIGYDCQTCQAGCCKAGSIGALDRERDFLLSKWPALAVFQTSQRPNQTTFAKAAPQCWFLQDDLRCAIEIGYGRDQKPHICRTHPVYLHPQLEQDLVVTSVSSGCVWLTGDLDRAIGTLTWAEVEALHGESQREGLYERREREVSSFGGLGPMVRQLFAAETRIRDEAPAHRTFLAYVAWQIAFTRKLGDTDAATVSVTRKDVAGARTETAALSTALSRFIGVPKTTIVRDPTFALSLFVPLLRLQFVQSFLIGPSMGRPVPKAALAWLLDAMPRLLLVLNAYCHAFTRVGTTVAPDFNTVSAAIRKFPARLMALANLDRPLTGSLGSTPREFPAHLVERLSALRERHVAQPEKPLGMILEEVCAGDAVGARLEFLDALADALMRG